jgi:hypothetical protein
MRKYISLALVTVLAMVGILAYGTGRALADNGGRPISVVMTGAQEVPPADPDGVGTASFTFNPGLGQVCYELTAENIEPATAAHIHIAPPGSPGPVVIPLIPPTDGSSSGCASADRALILNIIQNPDAYYVNVHNAIYPAGAIRAQLSK